MYEGDGERSKGLVVPPQPHPSHPLVKHICRKIAKKIKPPLTEPKRPLQLPQEDFLPLRIRQFARPQQRTATLSRPPEPRPIPVGILGVSLTLVLVLYEREVENLVADLPGEVAEEGGLRLEVGGGEIWVGGWGGGHGGEKGMVRKEGGEWVEVWEGA